MLEGGGEQAILQEGYTLVLAGEGKQEHNTDLVVWVEHRQRPVVQLEQWEQREQLGGQLLAGQLERNWTQLHQTHLHSHPLDSGWWWLWEQGWMPWLVGVWRELQN